MGDLMKRMPIDRQYLKEEWVKGGEFYAKIS